MSEDLVNMIYIIGNSRSGTTLMAKILGRGSDVFAFHELHFFEELCETDERKILTRSSAELLGAKLISIQEKGYFGLRNPKDYLDESANMLSNIFDKDLNSITVYKAFLIYETKKHNKNYPCEQMPRNTFYISEIKQHLPASRFINMVRDPRDVLLSQKGKWKRRFLGKHVSLRETLRSWANYNPIVISKLWNSTVRTADKNASNSDMITVRFEDLIGHPEKELNKICKFLGITYDNEMLNVQQSGSSNIADDPSKKGIKSSVTGRWKTGLNSGEVYWCEQINHSLMSKYNYECNHKFPNVFFLLSSIVNLPLKLSLSLVLNLSRTRNIFLSIKKRLI